MKLHNIMFVNVDIEHECGHVLPATIEIQGDAMEASVDESKRVTIRAFFAKNFIRFFAEGGRVHRITDCPKCHRFLPAGL